MVPLSSYVAHAGRLHQIRGLLERQVFVLLLGDEVVRRKGRRMDRPRGKKGAEKGESRWAAGFQ
jgi:hypothetical protein